MSFQDNDNNKPKSCNVREHPKMTVLNYKDQHCNLVVERDRLVAQSGTYSFQRKFAEKNRTPKTDLEMKIEILEKKLEDVDAENIILKENLKVIKLKLFMQRKILV